MEAPAPRSRALETIEAIREPLWLTMPMSPLGMGSTAKATEEVAASFACGLMKPRQLGPMMRIP